MKRLILILTLISGLSALYAQTSGIFEYEEYHSMAIITSCDSNADIMTIPEEIDSLSVSAISEGFLTSDRVREVRIPSSVVAITPGAFSAADGLEAVTVHPDNQRYASINGILYDKRSRSLMCYPPAREEASFEVPKGVWEIAPYAFSDTVNLQSVALPASVRLIGQQAFEDSCIASIDLPEGLRIIEDAAFFNCNSIRSLSLPSTLIFIGDDAVICSSLESINVASGNPIYESIDGVLFFRGASELIAYPAARETKGIYRIPASVRHIGEAAFCYAVNLDRILLTDGIESIGYGAFLGSGIKEISLPDSILDINPDAFARCDELRIIRATEGSYAYDMISRSEWARYLVYEPSWLTVYPSFPTLDAVWEEYGAMPEATENGPSYTPDELLEELAVFDTALGDYEYSSEFFRYVEYESVFDPESYYMIPDGTFGIKGNDETFSCVLCGLAPGNGRRYWGTIDSGSGLVDIAVADEGGGVTRILAYLNEDFELMYMSINGGESLV